MFSLEEKYPSSKQLLAWLRARGEYPVMKTSSEKRFFKEFLKKDKSDSKILIILAALLFTAWIPMDIAFCESKSHIMIAIRIFVFCLATVLALNFTEKLSSKAYAILKPLAMVSFTAGMEVLVCFCPASVAPVYVMGLIIVICIEGSIVHWRPINYTIYVSVSVLLLLIILLVFGLEKLFVYQIVFWLCTVYPLSFLAISKRYISMRRTFMLAEELRFKDEQTKETLRSALIMVAHDASNAIYKCNVAASAMLESSGISSSKQDSEDREDYHASETIFKASLSEISEVVFAAKSRLVFADGRLSFAGGEADLLVAIKTSCEGVRNLLKAKNIKLKLTVPREESLVIKADMAVLKISVISNILTNAIKYSPEGSQIRMIVGIKGCIARVILSDRGCGIPFDIIERVLNGKDVSDKIKPSGQDTNGIGLAHAIIALRSFGGDIAIRSNAQSQKGLKGTSLVIDFPLPGHHAKDKEILPQAS